MMVPGGREKEGVIAMDAGEEAGVDPPVDAAGDPLHGGEEILHEKASRGWKSLGRYDIFILTQNQGKKKEESA
jgi:hypothetical protein